MKVDKNSGFFNKESFLMKIMGLKIAIVTVLFQNEETLYIFVIIFPFQYIFLKIVHFLDFVVLKGCHTCVLALGSVKKNIYS